MARRVAPPCTVFEHLMRLASGGFRETLALLLDPVSLGQLHWTSRACAQAFPWRRLLSRRLWSSKDPYTDIDGWTEQVDLRFFDDERWVAVAAMWPLLLRQGLTLAINTAAAHGALPCLVWLRARGFTVVQPAACALAARFGHVDVIWFMQRSRWVATPWTTWATAAAARGGHVECLRVLRARGCPTWMEPMKGAFMYGTGDCDGEDDGPENRKYRFRVHKSQFDNVMRAAILSGSIECVASLDVPQERWPHIAARWAARSGSLPMLKYIQSLLVYRYLLRDDEVFAEAARSGSLECVLYLRDEIRTSWSDKVLHNALLSGNDELVDMMLAMGCEWSPSRVLDLDVPLSMFEWAERRGLPWDPLGVTRKALTAKPMREDVLRFLHRHDKLVFDLKELRTKHMGEWLYDEFVRNMTVLRELGLPWCTSYSERLAERGKSKQIMWLYEQGCPLSEECCTVLASANDYGAVRFLHARGFPLEQSMYRHRNLWDQGPGRMEIVAYLYEHGCPWDESMAPPEPARYTEDDGVRYMLRRLDNLDMKYGQC